MDLLRLKHLIVIELRSMMEPAFNNCYRQVEDHTDSVVLRGHISAGFRTIYDIGCDVHISVGAAYNGRFFGFLYW